LNERSECSLARSFKAPDQPPKASEFLCRAIKDEMDRRWPGARMSGDGRVFEEAYAALAGMQNPWRNATMHLDQKYTPEEARHIFDVVGGFMRKLASRMDEDGEPKV
jgi:hypothetical protein